MRALHLCFWLHHSYELLASNHWQKGYFGGEESFRKADQQDYQPLFALLERNSQRYPKLRVSLVVSGVWLEQAERWDNDLIKRLKKLVQNGNVALVAAPYYHSMAAFYDLDELTAQLKQYQEKIQQLFGVESQFLALPEFLYNNRLARWADKNKYLGVLSGPAPRGLDWRTHNRIYEAKGTDGLKILFENRTLSDDIIKARKSATMQVETTVKVAAEDADIAPEAELTATDFVRGMTDAVPAVKKSAETEKIATKTEFSAKKFQKQLDLEFLRGDIINLYFTANIFGKWRELGIIGFFDELFKMWQEMAGSHLVSVREIAKLAPTAEISIKNTTSLTAEAEKDYQLPAWWNDAQDKQSSELYQLRKKIVASEDKDLYYDFAKLTSIEHSIKSDEYAGILADLQDKVSKLVQESEDTAAEPVRFGLTESTSVRIKFDNKAKEAKERNQAFYQQMKEAAGEPLWTAEDMDDMEAAIQVMAQRMKMANIEQERDFTDFAEAEIVGTEDDFDDIDVMAEVLEKESPTQTTENTKEKFKVPLSKAAKATDKKDKKSKKKVFKKIVID